MSDLQKYINKRKGTDSDFALNFDTGYEEFKNGEMLKEARLKVRLTQEDIIDYNKSAKLNSISLHTTGFKFDRNEANTD